jgi:glycosyltransferase involved in cell wall biosynthesis
VTVFQRIAGSASPTSVRDPDRSRYAASGVGVVCNGRILNVGLTGVQRYTAQILSRLVDRVEIAAPARVVTGPQGHLWEQACLPFLVNQRVLWSPSNTGPLAVRRQVVTVHDMTSFDNPEWVGQSFGRWYRFLLPRLIRQAERAIAVSQFTKDRILVHVPVDPDKIVVIHSGVDERFAGNAPGDRGQLRARYSLPTDNYALSVCSLEPRKNLHGLLAAWTAALPELPKDMWLVLAGARGVRRVFGDFDLGALPPRVLAIGHVADEDLPALLAGATLFAYPSFCEGFGFPPLEAMASGVPVLTSDRTAIPEVVGNAALSVDPHDVGAIARGLVCLATDASLRQRLAMAGPIRAREFSWERAAEQTWQVLAEVAKTSVRARRSHSGIR